MLKARGRWNRAGEYGCLYTATDRATARAEYRKYRERAAATGLRRSHELVRLGVEVGNVLDLTTPGVRRRLSVREAALLGDEEESLETCHRIADWARSQGFGAILAPSAAGESGKVLAIYPDVSADRLKLDHAFDREPL